MHSSGTPWASAAATPLLAIAPVAELSRVVAAAPEVATALGYDIDAALQEPDGYWQLPSWPPAPDSCMATGRRQAW
jgi:hypothetical protein